MGLFREGALKTSLQYDMYRKYTPAEVSELLEGWKESGKVKQAQVEGRREKYLVLGEGITALESLEKWEDSQRLEAERNDNT